MLLNCQNTMYKHLNPNPKRAEEEIKISVIVLELK